MVRRKHVNNGVAEWKRWRLTWSATGTMEIKSRREALSVHVYMEIKITDPLDQRSDQWNTPISSGSSGNSSHL